MTAAEKEVASVAPTAASKALQLPLHAEAACSLRAQPSSVFDYVGVGRRLGMMFGPMYARWCVGQVTQDLVNQFGAPHE